MTEHFLVRDFETRSTIDLGGVGPYLYAQHPTTEVRCVGYAVDEEPAKLWLPGQPIPKEFKQAAKERWTVVAHNAGFEMQIERCILEPKFGFPKFKLQQQHCLMAMSSALALPPQLERCAKALDLDNKKDVVGNRLIKQLMKPRRPRKVEDPDQIYWFEDDERMQRSYDYCLQDVETERELYLSIPPLTESEHRVWMLDQQINDRGFQIDRKLCLAARKIALASGPLINIELDTLTGGKVTSFNQVALLKEWLAEYDVDVKSLDKAAIEELLQADLDPTVRRVIELRQLGAQASVKKVDALLQRTDCHDRARGAFVYHAAGTGRFASRGIQVHNLKRPETKDVEKAIPIIGTGDLKTVIRHYSNPLSVIGDLIRSMIIAKPGCVLIGGDFSGIEARVTAWLADEKRKLDVFRAYDAGVGPDPYLVAAASIDNIAIDILAKAYVDGEPWARESRQRGKAAELAFGYQGGVNAYRRFAPGGRGNDHGNEFKHRTRYEHHNKHDLTDEEIQKIKYRWRAKHPNIERFWRSINSAIWYVVKYHNVTAHCGRITLMCDDQPMLWLTLPSGRQLAYPHCRIERQITLPDGRFILHPKGTPTVAFKDNNAGQWRDTRIYGGFATENLVQAIARDLLTEAMTRIEKAGMPIVLTVHDEIVIEVPKGSVEPKRFAKLMAQTPAWADGLPVVVNPWENDRYTK